jgi:hypothetical protein
VALAATSAERIALWDTRAATQREEAWSVSGRVQRWVEPPPTGGGGDEEEKEGGGDGDPPPPPRTTTATTRPAGAMAQPAPAHGGAGGAGGGDDDAPAWHSNPEVVAIMSEPKVRSLLERMGGAGMHGEASADGQAAMDELAADTELIAKFRELQAKGVLGGGGAQAGVGGGVADPAAGGVSGAGQCMCLHWCQLGGRQLLLAGYENGKVFLGCDAATDERGAGRERGGERRARGGPPPLVWVAERQLHAEPVLHLAAVVHLASGGSDETASCGGGGGGRGARRRHRRRSAAEGQGGEEQALFVSVGADGRLCLCAVIMTASDGAEPAWSLSLLHSVDTDPVRAAAGTQAILYRPLCSVVRTVQQPPRTHARTHAVPCHHIFWGRQCRWLPMAADGCPPLQPSQWRMSPELARVCTPGVWCVDDFIGSAARGGRGGHGRGQLPRVRRPLRPFRRPF